MPLVGVYAARCDRSHCCLSRKYVKRCRGVGVRRCKLIVSYTSTSIMRMRHHLFVARLLAIRHAEVHRRATAARNTTHRDTQAQLHNTTHRDTQAHCTTQHNAPHVHRHTQAAWGIGLVILLTYCVSSAGIQTPRQCRCSCVECALTTTPSNFECPQAFNLSVIMIEFRFISLNEIQSLRG